MKTYYAVTAVIAVAALVAGIAVGKRDGAAETMATGNQYAMLLYENDSYQVPEPDRMAERVREYADWAQDLAASGRLVAGEKLADDGVLLSAEGASRDGIPIADEGAVAGYFVIAANDLEEATSIAATCPHLRYGGSISLRRIDT